MNCLERATVILSPSMRDTLGARLRHCAQELDRTAKTITKLRRRCAELMLLAEAPGGNSAPIDLDLVAEESADIIAALVSADNHRTDMEYQIAILAMFLNDGSFDTLDMFFLLQEVDGEDFVPPIAMAAIQEIIALYGNDVSGDAGHLSSAK